MDKKDIENKAYNYNSCLDKPKHNKLFVNFFCCFSTETLPSFMFFVWIVGLVLRYYFFFFESGGCSSYKLKNILGITADNPLRS